MTINQLRVMPFHGSAYPEMACRTLEKQCIAKILAPGKVEVGLSMKNLSQYAYAPGEMILCRRDTEEWLRCNDSIQMLIIELPDQALQAVAEEAGTNKVEFEATPFLQEKRVAALISAIENESANGCLYGQLYMDAIGQAMACALAQARGLLRRPLRDYKCGLAPVRLRRVTEQIHAQLGQELNLEQMARTAGLSTTHFSKMFRQSTGLPPHQFVLNARIVRAKEMLRQSSARVIDIAVACGFQTPQHFSRVFRAICGVSPTEYRSDCGQPRSTSIYLN